MTRIDLPQADGSYRSVELTASEWTPPATKFTSRVAFAAAHVVADPLGDNVPGAPAVVDWDATLAYRQHLFSYGFGVAEAMDTAQRGMGLDWAATQELISRSSKQAAQAGARIASGVGTDHLPAGPSTLEQLRAGYLEQLEFVEGAGSQAILMCSRQLAATAKTADDYLSVYSELLEQASSPVILHWLGPAFDPALAGYWGSDDVETANQTFLDLINGNPGKVDGVKVSLLSASHETGLRSRLPEGVRLYTGDDFNYPELIRGDGTHYSDALLGIFAAIAPAAAAALHALDADDLDTYERVFAPTVPLSRHIFEAPTFYYKTGIAFMSWINGHQDAFAMVGGLQSARSIVHLSEIVRLASEAGLIVDPDLAAGRMRALLEVNGLAR